MLQVHVRPQEAAQPGWWLQQGLQGIAPQQQQQWWSIWRGIEVTKSVQGSLNAEVLAASNAAAATVVGRLPWQWQQRSDAHMIWPGGSAALLGMRDA